MISNHHSSIMPEPAVAAFKKVKDMDSVLDRVSQMETKMAAVADANIRIAEQATSNVAEMSSLKDTLKQ